MGVRKISRLVLTIAIPTYNRVEKLTATLGRIKAMIEASPLLRENVEILVSDNGSTDDTPNVLRAFNSGSMRYRWIRQQENLGLDGNMRFLYQHADAEYVWYFSDDDVLFPNSIDRVLGALRTYSPDALLFSFVQPVGSTIRTFDFPQDVAVVNDPAQMIELLARYPKLSIYIYRRLQLSEDDWEGLRQFLGTNYDFIAVGYTLLQKSTAPKLCVISTPLAGCDEDFNKIRFSPETWGNAWVVFQHPYVRKVAPGLEKVKRRDAYYDQIQALVAVKAGALEVPDMVTYDQFIDALEIRWHWLLQKPRSLGQMCFLKLGLVPLWLKLFSRSRVR